MNSTPSIAALVLNWNDYEDTKQCVESLKKQDYPELDIFVIDNGSSDRSAQKIKNEYQGITVILNEDNLGFGGGINEGLREINRDEYSYIWLLNSDIIVPEGEEVLTSLVQFISDNPDCGIVSPLIKRFPETDELWFWRGDVSENGQSNHAPATEYNDEKSVENDYIPLAAALCDTVIFEDVGLIPEEYFLYFEDVEFSVRLKGMGYKLLTNGSTAVYHKVSKSSSGPLGPTTTYYMARNRWLFERRCRGGVNASFFISLIRSLIIDAALRLKKGNLYSFLALIRGTLAGLTGADGRGPYP